MYTDLDLGSVAPGPETCPALLYVFCPSGLAILRAPRSRPQSSLLVANLPLHSAPYGRNWLHLTLESAVSMFRPLRLMPQNFWPHQQTKACIPGPISDAVIGSS